MENESNVPSRRRVVQLGAVAGLGLVGAGALAGCGGDEDGASGATSSVAGTGGDAGAGGALAKVADVPVGGALAVQAGDGTEVILVQAEAGTVTGLRAACTHQGCPVKPNGASLDCNCHGSSFALDGSVTKGPATNPLPPFPVTVQGEDVVAG